VCATASVLVCVCGMPFQHATYILDTLGFKLVLLLVCVLHPGPWMDGGNVKSSVRCGSLLFAAASLCLVYGQQHVPLCACLGVAVCIPGSPCCTAGGANRCSCTCGVLWHRMPMHRTYSSPWLALVFNTVLSCIWSCGWRQGHNLLPAFGYITGIKGTADPGVLLWLPLVRCMPTPASCM
jgi:hypothetical protein